jgi:hypothetical protein
MKIKQRDRVTELGQNLGRFSAFLAERGTLVLEKAGLLGLELPFQKTQMCNSCACRTGTIPNGCEQTQLDLLKAAAEGEAFLCHAPNDGKLCAGWASVRAQIVAQPLPKEMLQILHEHEYSPPDKEQHE